MRVGNEGAGRKPLHPPVFSDLASEAQGVRREETTHRQILSRPGHQPFRSLAERGIETVPVKPGLLTRALSSLSSSFISFFSSAISSVAGASQKEFRSLINGELEKQKLLKQKVEALELRLKRTGESLQALRNHMLRNHMLRNNIEALTPEQMDNYSDLVKEQLRIQEDWILNKAYLTRSPEQVRCYEQTLSANKIKLSRSMKVLEENISTGIEALLVLKDVFKKRRKDKHQGKVFEMSLGDIKVTDPDRYDFQLKNLVVNVGRFCFENGQLELEVPELSAHCFSLEDSKTVGPVKIKGSCRIRIGEPLAEPLNQLLTCRKTEIFSAYKKFSEAFGTLLAETSGADAKRHLGDVIQCSVDGLEMEERGLKSGLFTQTMGEAVIRLFAPMVTTWKKELGADSLDKSRVQEQVDTLKAESAAALCRAREKAIKMLEDDLPKIKESRAKKVCQDMLAGYRKDLERSEKLLQKKKTTLSTHKQQTAAMVYRQANADQSIHSYQNALKLFHTLRGLAREQVSDPSASASMVFDEQRIDFTDTAHAELSSASLKFSGFNLGEEGVLEIKVPDVALNLGLVNEVSETREAFPASLKDVSLKVNPPMGAIIYQILQLDFPLEFRILEPLWRQYQACTSEHYNAKGAHSPVDVASYFAIDIGSVACLAEGDARVEAGERPVADKELMALGLSDLMGQTLKVSQLDKLFREKMGMSPQSSSQIMNLLCLGLLGEPKPLSPMNEQEVLSTPVTPPSPPVPVSPVVHSDHQSETPVERKQPVLRAPQETVEEVALTKTEIRLGDLSDCPGVSQVKVAVKGDTPQVSFAIKAPALKVLGKLSLLLSWLVGSDLSLSVQAPLKEDVVQFSQPAIRVRGARMPFLGTWLANYWLKHAMARGELEINSHQIAGQTGLKFVRLESD
ncbi:hypothetical protein [Endozoicomonas sp. 4G]|uniref:hypothetical protein n=1 Tax=Endozoicomonas sp. 4G TaxID=2872754 RepID=UPI002078F743|nr:hypothetical protein [Endozoicomonas sp. 4G]